MTIKEHLVNKGNGNNYGVDLSLERSMRKRIYYILSGSLYNSEYKGSDGIRRNTRFNGKFQTKVTLGKEIKYDVKKGANSLGANISGIFAGGMRYTPVDLRLSTLLNSTVLDEASAFSNKLRDYFRLDARLSWRKDRHGYTEIFAIDIQNLTNRKNTAWFYYDRLRKSATSKYQLGIMPFFSYRINF